MLLSLPVELVERTVRFTVPQDYSSATYLDRQDTLRSLCLVCRDLFPLAQRVLEETVRVSKAGTVKKVEQLIEDDAKRAKVRVLALEDHMIEAVKKGCAGLRDVRLYNVDELDAGWLGVCTKLTNLVLSECTLSPQSDRPVLLAVRHLTWAEWDLATNTQGDFPSRRHFPSLKHCAIPLTRFDNPHYQPFIASLPTWVDTVVVTDNDLDEGVFAGITADKDTPAVLAETVLDADTVHTWAASLACILHSRLYEGGNSTLEGPAAVHLFTSLTRSLSSATSVTLTYLLLPTRFRPSILPHSDLRTSIETFFAACTSRGITVDSEDTDESPGGSLVSPKFAAYVAEKREGEAQGREQTAKVSEGGGRA
ncbi:hypothetical protein JCM10213_000835 [Rhodosporidiobolus nylandii]